MKSLKSFKRLYSQQPAFLLLFFLIFLIIFYAAVFSIFMRTFEGRAVSLVDAFFWTVSFITTTGSTLPISTAPLKLLSIIIQISSLALLFLAFPLIVLPQIEQRLGRSLPTMIGESLKDHVIIFGYNPLAESFIDELSGGERAILIVSQDREVVATLLKEGKQAIFGDPVSEKVHIDVGVERAATVIANTEDEENANVVLTASAMGAANIIAIIDNLEEAKYYEYAGADKVISPKDLLGTYLSKKATTSLKDELFGENEILAGLDVVELPIYPGSPIDGISLSESDLGSKTGTSVVGIWNRGKLELEPGPNSRLSAENVLMAVGTRDQLIELQKLTQSANNQVKLSKRHFVIAGYGDVGRRVSEELRAQKISFITIDPLERPGKYLRGDATKEQVLIDAKIDKASTYIVAGHIDQDNIFTTLLARKLNPSLHIIARANQQSSVDKLYRAGADFVFSLSTVAGQMVARMIQGDRVVTLAEGLKVLSVKISGKLANRTIGQLRIRTFTGCTVIAIKDDSRLIANPGPDTLLGGGGTMVVLGSHQQIHKFQRYFNIE